MQTKEKTVGDNVVQVKLTLRELVMVKRALVRVQFPDAEDEAVLVRAFEKITERVASQFGKYY